MPTESQYALFSEHAYRRPNNGAAEDNEAYQDNFGPLPAGWVWRNDLNESEFFAWLRDQGCLPPENTGFSAWTYVNGTELVIAFRGTEFPSVGDIVADFNLALGRVPDQMALAYHYTQWIKQRIGVTTDQITFTGHSLGGALASGMAAYFGRPAHVFNPAPARDTTEQLLLGRSFGTSSSRLFPDIPPAPGVASPADAQSRVMIADSLVERTTVKGELVHMLGAFDYIGAERIIDLGVPSGVSLTEAIGLHGISLVV